MLTNLRILYLHGVLANAEQAVELAHWEPLRSLSRLVFLSISGNALPGLPPAVAAMTQLQVSHCSQAAVVIRSLPASCCLLCCGELLTQACCACLPTCSCLLG